MTTIIRQEKERYNVVDGDQDQHVYTLFVFCHSGIYRFDAFSSSFLRCEHQMHVGWFEDYLTCSPHQFNFLRGIKSYLNLIVRVFFIFNF